MKQLRNLALAALLVAPFVLIGCGSDAPELSDSEKQGFNGAPKGSGPRSAEAANSIADFQKEYQRRHPETINSGPPPGGGMKAPGDKS